MSRLVVISDSHVSARAPEASTNWAAVVEYVSSTGPDLVVHAGDLTVDGASEPSELELARAHLDQLPVPWVAVPGNHDIGDNPGGTDGDPVDEARLAAWEGALGPDRFVTEVGGWTVVGVNAQLFGSDLAAAAEQWAWLEGVFPTDRPVVLVTHKPLTADEAELAVAPPSRFVPIDARERIHGLASHMPLVVSGHVHQFRVLANGRVHAWAPSSWAVLPEHVQATVGLKRCGVLSVELTDGGDARVEMVEPPNIKQLTLGVDVPSPYEH